MSVIIKHCLKNNRYDYFIIITIFSVIFAGPLFGAFTPVRVIGFLFFFYYLLGRKASKGIGSLVLFLYGALIYSFLALFWATDLPMYIVSFLQSICCVGVFLFIYYSSLKSRNPIGSILCGWICFTILNLLVSFWEIYTGQHTAEGQFQADNYTISIDGVRELRPYAAVTYGNFNSLSIVLCLCLFMLILYLEYIKGYFKNIFAIILVFLIVVVELVNTSRGCLMSLLFAMIPFYLAVRKGRYIKYLILAILIGVGIFLWHEYSEIIVFLVERKFDSRAREGGIFQDPRWLLWNKGIDIAVNWLCLGSGPGSMIYEYGKERVWITYAHNLWIQSLIEYGLVLTLALAYGIARLAMKTYFSSERLLRLIGIILVFCWPMLTIVDEDYMKVFHWTFFASLLSIYHYLHKCKI